MEDSSIYKVRKMKKDNFFILGFILLFALILSSCGDSTITPTENTFDSQNENLAKPTLSNDSNDTTLHVEQSAQPQLSYDGISKIVLLWSGRWPPKSLEDDADEPEHWFSETVFFSDGRVEYTESSYYGIVLKSDLWQVDDNAFIELVGILNEQGFFSLPEVFVYGSFDESAYTLGVHIGDAVCSSGYGPSNEIVDDEKSYDIHSACCYAFMDITGKH